MAVRTFTAMQWNVLGDHLAQTGGFVRVAAPLLEWEHRFPLMLDTIKAVGPHVLCMQEVTHFDQFQSGLGHLDGVFNPKNYGPDDPERADGVAVMWDRAVFAKAQEHVFHYPSPADASVLDSQAGVIVVLEVVGSAPPQHVVVAATHLKAKKGAENEAKRHHQMSYMMERLASVVSGVPGEPPVLLTGDFNSAPEDSTRAVVAACEAPALTSVYGPGGPETEPPITTCKVRAAGLTARCIDYMFQRGLRVVSTTPLPATAAELGDDALPSSTYPSDHLHLAATFALE